MSDAFRPFTADQLLGSLGGQSGEPKPAAPPAGARAAPTGDSIFDALVVQESGGRQFDKSGAPLTSKAGATGVAQVMPGTAREAAALAGLEFDEQKYRNDPQYNIALGRAYYNKQLNDFGSVPQALAAYNAGPGAVRRAVAYAEKQGAPDTWLSYLPEETRKYVPSILARAGAPAPQQAAAAAPAADPKYFGKPASEYIPLSSATPAATAGDYVREGLASFLGGIGSMGQAVGEIGAAVANKVTGTEDYEGKNLLNSAAESLRAGMTEGGKQARADSEIKGSLSDLSSIELPSSPAGWAMLAANTAGSLASTIVPMVGPMARVASAAKAGDAARMASAARTAQAAGAGFGAAQTGGAAAEEVRKSAADAVGKMTHEQLLQQVPAYADNFARTGDQAQARSAAVNAAAQLAGMGAAVFGAAGGAVNARLIEDILLKKGVSKALGQSMPVRFGVGMPVLGVAEGGQEVSEKVGQNIGEDIALGRGAMADPLRDTAGDFIGGMAGGTMTGSVAAMRRPELEPAAAKASEPNSPLSKATVAGNATTDAAQPPAPPVDTAKRLAELEAKAKGTPEQTIMGADGQPIAIPGQPGSIFTPEEQQEYQALKAARDATPGAVQDEIKPRAFAIREQLKANRGILDALRSPDAPYSAKAVLNDLAIASSSSTQAAKREQALGRIEVALEWAGANPVAPVETNLDELPGVVQGGERPAGPRPTLGQLRAGADRDAELLGQRDGGLANLAGQRTRDEADRREQAAIDIESAPGASPETLGRAASLREQAAALRRRADELDARPGAGGTVGTMTARDRASIDDQRQANLEQRMRAPAAEAPVTAPRASGITPTEQAGLEAAAMAGDERQRRRQDEPRQVVIDRALRNVEERGGAASPAEAKIFAEAGLGKPYDRIDEGLAGQPTVDERLTQATGIALGRAPRESMRQGQQSEADLVAQEQRERSDSRMQALAAERAAARVGRPGERPAAAPPAAGEVISALKTIPALRSAEQKSLVDIARRSYSAEQMRIMSDAAVNPANLTATDKLQLQQLHDARRSDERQAAPHALPDMVAPAGAGPAFLRKRRAQIEAAAAQGFETVERRDGVFVMRNAKTGAEVSLSGRADAAMAREAVRRLVDARAHAAATSPQNDRKEPSWAQIDAINWKKGDPIQLNGVTVRIENPVGSIRRARPDAPVQWQTKMKHHYGEIAGTKGADGDPVDVFVGPNPASPKIWVIDQVDERGKFDEHKVMFGFDSEAAARAGYLSNFSSGWKGLGKITEMTQDEFRAWAKDQGATMAPAAEAVSPTSDSDAKSATTDAAPAPAADVAAAVDPATGTFTVRMGGKDVTFQRSDTSKLGDFESPERDGRATKISKRSAAIIKGIGQALGKKVVFFSDVSGVRPGDGFVIPSQPDTIYLNEVSTISPLAVLGHELMHTLRATNPKAWDAIAAVVRTRVKDPKGFRRDYYGAEEAQKRGDGALGEEQGGELEELVSDLGGNLMADPKFWREVFAKIQADNGAESRGIIARLVAQLQALLDLAVSAVKGPKFKADAFVADADAIRAAYRDALAQHVKAAGQSIAGMQADVLKARQREKGAAKPSAQASQSPERGIHFSKAERTSINGAYYGTGLKGLEAERLRDSRDPRLKIRAYFYVDEGNGVRPEAGVGGVAHEAKLPKLYDAKANAEKLWNSGDLNGTESRILDAGYNGYFVKQHETGQGFAVVIGDAAKSIPVTRITDPKIQSSVASLPPEPIKRVLMSKEMAAVNVDNIPGARMRSGILFVMPEQVEAANAEMARIGSDTRFSKERLATPADQLDEVRQKYEGTEQWLKAPDGTATKLTERQWLHVRTPSFKKWFGDWEKFAGREGGVWNDSKGEVSKVVGSNGEPLVVYHGTSTGGFAEFWAPSGTKRGDLGIFLTDDLSMAKTYVRRGRGRLLTAADIAEPEETRDDVPGIYALFVNIRDPNEADFEGANWEGSRNGQFIVVDDDGEQLYTDDGRGYFEDRDDAFELVMAKGGDIEEAPDHYETTDGVVREARRMDRDGAIIHNVTDDGGGASSYAGEPNDVYVAFDPNQVKSADFNGGEYSISEDDIRRSAPRKRQQDPAVGDKTDVSRLPAGVAIPQSAAVGGLESSLKLASSKSYRRGRDLKQDIQARVLEAARAARVNLSERTKATFEFLSGMVVGDAKFALTSNENAVGWYDEKVSRALGALSTLHPEIEDDPASRLAFLWALAVTSNGLKVDRNFDLAVTAYRQWRASGTMPTDVGIGNAAQVINKGLAAFNDLTAKVGDKRLLKFMSTKFTAGEVERMLGFKVGGEWKGTPVRGAAILGPKIGNGFFSNLNGYFDALTMDRWLMRTWGRMTGTLLEVTDADIKKSRKKLQDAIKALTPAERRTLSGLIGKPVKAALTRPEIDAVSKASQKASMKVDKRKVMQSSPAMDAFRKAANGLHMTLDGQKEAPSGPAERNWIRAVFQQALDQLRADGLNMTMSDLQALLWYPERRLYDAAKSDEDIEAGYEDDEAPDYANAAFNLAVKNGVSRQVAMAAMDAAEARGTVVGAPLTDDERAAMLKEFRAPPEQQFQLAFEVAPNPDNAEATEQWNGLPNKEKERITKLVKDDVLPELAEALGLKVGKSVGALGGFEGQINPNVITEYKPKQVSVQQARALAAAIGMALDQKSVAMMDSRASQEVGMVRIKLSKKADALVPRIMAAITAEVPAANGFTARGQNIDILNFTDLPSEELSNKIADVLDELEEDLEYQISFGDVRSELIEESDYEGQATRVRPGYEQEVLQRIERARDRARGIVAQELAAVRSAGQVPGRAGNARRADAAGEVLRSAARDRGGLDQGRGDQAGAGARDGDGRFAPLPGYAHGNVKGAAGPDPRLVEVAERYARQNGIDLRRQAAYVEVDPERARRIAEAYAAMPHAPQDPKVKAAYANLIEQTRAQYDALADAGYSFYFFDETNDPYQGNPWNAMRDLRANRTMGVYATEAGFGSSNLDVSDNPLLADTGIEWPFGGADGKKKRVLANDLFRAVHDAFGHGLEGAGFRAQGEENAWQAHVRLFTGSAVGAITSETRGQNSWLNYGPNGESNRSAKVEDTVFADQKTGLMPEWTWTEGRVGDEAISVTPPADLVAIFEGLQSRGLPRKRAEEAAAAHPQAATIGEVNENFLDILEELEASGRLKINCN